MKFIVREDDREYEFLLSPGLYIIGRDPTCDLTLDSHHISRRHMSCTVTDREVRVKDLGSRNNILVGGVRVKEATLKDGDEVKVGEMCLLFQATGMQAAHAPIQEEAHLGAVDPGIEDDEATPSAGSLVLQDASAAQVVQRDGHWYVTDPATGREVEIVPADQAPAAPQRKGLLSTPKGRLILGGAAAVVLALLVVAIVKTRSASPAPTLAGRQFNALIDSTLDALDRGDTERAASLAQQALAGRPDSEVAAVVSELAEVWDPWREDFFAHWGEVDRALENLYRVHSGSHTEEFVRQYRDWIDNELAYSQMATAAKEALQAGRYEDAWKNLADVPAGSVVRERDAELFETARTRLNQHIKTRMRFAAARQDWSPAREWAQKLRTYFPEEEQQAEQIVARYLLYENHAESMRAAKDAIASERFADAERALGTVPEGSPYHGEAQRLRQRARAGEQYTRALALYNNGDAPRAIKLLEGQDTDAARSLKRHVEAIHKIYQDALTEKRAMRLAAAQQHWQDLVQAETDPDNSYRTEALRELDGMQTNRRGYARRLAREADRAYKQEDLARARELYENAMRMDPDGLEGVKELADMADRGRMDYRVGVAKRDRDPREALQRLKQACDLLPPTDKYYTLAAEAKKELEEELNGR